MLCITKGLIEGFHIRAYYGIHISHLLFADKLRNLHVLLKSFEQASGLNINLRKLNLGGHMGLSILSFSFHIFGYASRREIWSCTFLRLHY